MTSVHGTPRSLRKADVDKGNKTTGKADQTKAKSTPTITRQKEVEKIVEIRQFDMSYDGGVYEVIANADSKALPQDRQPGFGNDHGDALYDTLNTITQATQQQMDLVRRMMYFMTVLLLIVCLTATSSLILTVMMLMSDNTLSSNQATLSPGMSLTVNDMQGATVCLLLQSGYVRTTRFAAIAFNSLQFVGNQTFCSNDYEIAIRGRKTESRKRSLFLNWPKFSKQARKTNSLFPVC